MNEEGAKVVTLSPDGPVLISADVHGNLADFERLREVFLAAPDATWISVGDWVHGPTGERDDIVDGEGQPLYAYPDETPALLTELFALMDRFPDRVHSLCGNHEHAHIGGRRTGKFHRDEAAFLESNCTPALVSELRARFASWPMIIRLPSAGVVITHGAPLPGTAEEYELIRYAGNRDARPLELARAAMSRYGFAAGEDRALALALGCDVLVHGHDREELGHAASGDVAMLLCTSFGARRAYKEYLWLERGRRYPTLAELETALRRLY